MRYSSVESEYLVEVLKSALECAPLSKAPENIDWQRFVDLANKQQVYSIIAPVLGELSIPQEHLQRLNVYNQNELLRIIAMKNELEEIENELQQSKIEYMLVKGSVLRSYYPQQKMRQMTDIDILYKKQHQEKLISMMKKRGYYLKTAQANSDDFFKKPFYTFEFHRDIFDEADEFSPDFDLWERAVPDNKNSCKYHINNEDLFIYSLCHMYDHYSISGCGIRFVCDIYVLLNAFDKLDWDYINCKFTEFGFADFCDTAISLTKTIFMNGTSDDKQQNLLDFILSGGVYGKEKDFDTVISEKFGNSKMRYILHRLFPSKKQMLGNYPQLRKRPFLLPLYYIVRIFQKLKYDDKTIKDEIKKIK